MASSEADRIIAALQRFAERLERLLEIYPPPFEGRGPEIGEMLARLSTAIEKIGRDPVPAMLSSGRKTLFAMSSEVAEMERRHGISDEP